MNIRPENEINSEEEMNLYDYWKALVKRKKIFVGIFLIPLVMVTIISFSIPRYYRGEGEISYPVLSAPNISSVLSAPNIVRLIGNIDDSQKVKIFANNPDAVKSVSISLPKTSNDKIKIIVDAKTSNIIPQAFKDISDYIGNLPEIKEEIARIKEETDMKIKHLTEAREANLIFLNQIKEMMKKKLISLIAINPADLIKKDADLSLEIMNLQKPVMKFGKLGPLLITVQPSNSEIKQRIIITSILSLLTGILIIFFLEYIDRIKRRENKQRRLP